MSRFGSCYYTTVVSCGFGLVGGVVAGGDFEVLGWFGQVECGQDALLPGGEDGALRDAALGGGQGDQMHAVEFLAQVAPGVAGGGFGDPHEQQR